MRKILSATVVCVICASLGLITGCNTVKGVGKDVSKGGREIQRAAS